MRETKEKKLCLSKVKVANPFAVQGTEEEKRTNGEERPAMVTWVRVFC